MIAENEKAKKANEEILVFQQKLVPLIRKMHDDGKICFSSVLHEPASGGHSWQPNEKIRGVFLNELFEAQADWAIEVSKNISDDYQKVIVKYFKEYPSKQKNILEVGSEWLFASLSRWSELIMEERLMHNDEVETLKSDFENAIKVKKEEFFGYCHGNVIGDHVFVGENKELYLFGTRIVPRPGRKYYDFLRSIDWFLLKSDNKKTDYETIIGWMNKYLSDVDMEELKLVFALRCIGILGWDILHRGDLGKGDVQTKKKLLLRFIKKFNN